MYTMYKIVSTQCTHNVYKYIQNIMFLQTSLCPVDLLINATVNLLILSKNELNPVV